MKAKIPLKIALRLIVLVSVFVPITNTLHAQICPAGPTTFYGLNL